MIISSKAWMQEKGQKELFIFCILILFAKILINPYENEAI